MGTLTEIDSQSIEAFAVTNLDGFRWLCFTEFNQDDLFDLMTEYAIAGCIICVIGAFVLLLWMWIVVHEKFVKSKNSEKHSKDPSVRMKDKYFQIQTSRAMLAMTISFLVFVVLWVGWSIASTDSVYNLVRHCITSSSQWSIDTTEYTVMQPAVINKLLFQYWRMQESTLVSNSNNNKFGECTGTVSDDIDHLLCQMVETYPAVAWVYIGYANGAFVGCTSTASSTSYSRTAIGLSDNSTGFTMVEYKYDSSTKKRDVSQVVYNSTSIFDSRTRPWYSQGVEVYNDLINGDYTSHPTNASWTPPYVNENDKTVGVTSCMPFWSSDHQRGVFAADLTLGQVSVNLAAAKLGDIGRTWILETDKVNMIGTSTSDSLLAESGTDCAQGDACTKSAYVFDDDTIKTQSRAIAAKYEYVWSDANSFYQDRQDPIMKAAAVGSNSQLQWTQIVMTDYDYFYLESNRQMLMSLVIVVIGFPLVAFMLKSIVDKLKEDRAKGVKKRLFTGDDHTDLAGKIAELDRLTELHTVRGDWQDKDAIISKKANETLYSTMKLLKGDLHQYFEKKRPERERAAVKYLAMAQENGGGIEHMVMKDKFRHKNRSDGDEMMNKADSTFSFMWKMYKICVEGYAWAHSMLVLIFLFMAFEYSEQDDDIATMTVQFFLITILWFDAVVNMYFTYMERKAMEAAPTKLKVFHLCVASLNFIFLIVKAFGYSDPVRFTRPLLLFFRSKKVVKAFSLFTNSILSAASVFIIFFMTITLAAILALVLFRNEMSGDPTLNNFMESFNQMFVLVATGENYADIVPAAILLSDWYFFFFAVFTLVGLFFLGSLLIATFESQYQQEQVEFTILEKETLLHRLAPTFCLWTYTMPYADKLDKNKLASIGKELTIRKAAFKQLMQQFWQHDSQKPILVELCASQKRKRLLIKELNAKRELGKPFSRIALEREINLKPLDDATEEGFDAH